MVPNHVLETSIPYRLTPSALILIRWIDWGHFLPPFVPADDSKDFAVDIRRTQTVKSMLVRPFSYSSSLMLPADQKTIAWTEVAFFKLSIPWFADGDAVATYPMILTHSPIRVSVELRVSNNNLTSTRAWWSLPGGYLCSRVSTAEEMSYSLTLWVFLAFWNDWTEIINQLYLRKFEWQYRIADLGYSF